jgi:uncharacterized protein DUF6458
MGIPISLFLLTGGAILAFAVTGTTTGVDIQAVGWILMAAGFVGLLLSLVLWDSWAGGGFWQRGGYDAPPPARHPPRRGGRRVVREDVEERY